MNPRIIKKRGERQELLEKLEAFRRKAEQEEAELHAKNEKKTAHMEERLAALEAELAALENTDIIGLVRAQNLTVDELAVLLDGHGTQIIKPIKEGETHEE